MDKIEKISRRRKEAHAKLQSPKSKVYQAFLHVEEAAFSDGAVPKKTKELIAVGIAVKTDCESCMQWHIDQAAGAGATMREVLEAVEVGIEMGGGPATVSARFALEVLRRRHHDGLHAAVRKVARYPDRRVPAPRRIHGAPGRAAGA